MPFLVNWWHDRLYYEREAVDIAHQQRALSPELLVMYNRPISVVDLQALHDRVLSLVEAK